MIIMMKNFVSFIGSSKKVCCFEVPIYVLFVTYLFPFPIACLHAYTSHLFGYTLLYGPKY